MKQNKKQSFEEIYEQNQGMVYQMCLGFVKGDADIASDLSQEVFISVWRNLEKFRGASSYKTWIYRITVNTCLQYVKKESKERTYKTNELENASSIAVESEHKNDEEIMELYNAIGQLKKIDRLIIMMVLENQSYESISEVIGINAINVRVKIHRIKKRLEKILKNKNDE